MGHEAVRAWVAAYERVWRSGGAHALERLFTPDARYLRSPYATPDVGLAAIRAGWLDDDDGEVFTLDASIVAVDGDRAVVRVLVRYGEPVRQEYTDLWLLRFAADGRALEFEEWAYWPDRPFTVDTDDTVDPHG